VDEERYHALATGGDRPLKGLRFREGEGVRRDHSPTNTDPEGPGRYFVAGRRRRGFVREKGWRKRNPEPRQRVGASMGRGKSLRKGAEIILSENIAGN